MTIRTSGLFQLVTINIMLAFGLLIIANAQTAVAQEKKDDEQTDAKPKTLEELKSDEGGFVVKQFGSPVNNVVEVKLPEQDDQGKAPTQEKIKVHMFLSQSDDQNVAMVTAYHDLETKPTTDDEIKKVLDGSVIGAVNSVEGKATKHENVTLDKHKGRHVEYGAKRFGQELLGISRIYLRGNRVYQTNYICTSDKFDKEQADEYFASFKFIDIVESKKDETKDDTKKNDKANSQKGNKDKN